MDVTGTDIWYYFVCKREVWLIAHQIAADQEDDNLEIGRFISETTYQRNKKEVMIGNIKVDRIRHEGDTLIVGEVKKSSAYEKSAYYQLLYYLDTLRKMGIEAQGELLFPKEKKVVKVQWTEEGKRVLETATSDIQSIVRFPVPPEPKKINFCRSCAYREYCFAEEE